MYVYNHVTTTQIEIQNISVSQRAMLFHSHCPFQRVIFILTSVTIGYLVVVLELCINGIIQHIYSFLCLAFLFSMLVLQFISFCVHL